MGSVPGRACFSKMREAMLSRFGRPSILDCAVDVVVSAASAAPVRAASLPPSSSLRR